MRFLIAAALLWPGRADAGLFKRAPTDPQGQAVRASAQAAAGPAAAKAPAAAPLSAALTALLADTPEARRQAEAAQEERAAAWTAKFDGRQARQAEELAVLAEPWSTKAQLAKLEKLPAAKSPDTVRFTVIGDADPGEFWFIRAANPAGKNMFSNLLAKAAGQGEFIVQLGDMISRGTVRNYKRLLQLLEDSKIAMPFLTVPGNHERSSPRAKGESDDELYRAVFGPSDHYMDRGGVRFVFLDTSARKLTPAQLGWLDAALRTGPEIRHKVVFTHIAPSGLAKWTDFMGVKDVGSFTPGSAEFMAIAESRGVDRVYFGHVHGFDVIDRGSTRYVLTGGGGSPLFAVNIKQRFHHFLTVEAGPDGIVETVHKADGSRMRVPPLK